MCACNFCILPIHYVDTDECASLDLNQCDQVCDNTEGSYSCSCDDGYTLNSDGHACDGNFDLENDFVTEN